MFSSDLGTITHAMLNVPLKNGIKLFQYVKEKALKIVTVIQINYKTSQLMFCLKIK